MSTLLEDVTGPQGKPDGIPDLVVTNAGSKTITVLRGIGNNGQGTSFFDDRPQDILIAHLPSLFGLTLPLITVPAGPVLLPMSGGIVPLPLPGAPASSPVFVAPAGQIIATVGVVPSSSDLVVAFQGGQVELLHRNPTTGLYSVAASLTPLNGVPPNPSALTVLETASGLEVLVTSAGFDQIFIFTLESTDTAEATDESMAIAESVDSPPSTLILATQPASTGGTSISESGTPATQVSTASTTPSTSTPVTQVSASSTTPSSTPTTTASSSAANPSSNTTVTVPLPVSAAATPGNSAGVSPAPSLATANVLPNLTPVNFLANTASVDVSHSSAAAAQGGGAEVQRNFGRVLNNLSLNAGVGFTQRTDLVSDLEVAGSLLTGTTPSTALLPQKGSDVAPVATMMDRDAGPGEIAGAGGEPDRDDPYNFVAGLDDTWHRLPTIPAHPSTPAVDNVFQQTPSIAANVGVQERNQRIPELLPEIPPAATAWPTQATARAPGGNHTSWAWLLTGLLLGVGLSPPAAGVERKSRAAGVDPHL